jgi:hypothetical protein
LLSFLMTVAGSMRPDTVTFPCSASMLLWYTPADQRSNFSFLFLLKIRLGGGDAFSEHRSSKSEQTEQNTTKHLLGSKAVSCVSTTQESKGRGLFFKRKRMKQFDLEECLFVCYHRSCGGSS